MPHQRSQDIFIRASAVQAYRACADVSLWTRYMPAVREARRINESEAEETVEISAEGFDGLLTWRSTRTLQPDSLSIQFVRIAPAPPLVAMRGVWRFIPEGDGCVVRIEHEFELCDAARLNDVLSAITSNVTRDLEGMKVYLENRAPTIAILITGASAGIGLAIARALLSDQRHAVLLGSRDPTRLEAAKVALLETRRR